MSFTLVDDPAEAPALRRALASEAWIALDSEAAGFHRYSDRLSLLQITTSKGTWIVDPLAFDPSEAMRGPLGNPAIEIIMHGADYDMRLLDRDLDIAIHGLFDTQIAAAMLGETALGLAALLETHLGIKLSKKYQRADWAKRPIPDEMLEYAASDTKHLRDLSDLLRERLIKAGRLEWALEECRALERTRWLEEAQEEDPVARVKGARDLQPRELAALREALAWRDQIAKARDRAPFRVAGDPALIEAVLRRPRTVDELAEVKGLSPALARQDGAELIERFDRIAALPEKELIGFPRKPRGNGPGRATPEMEERAEKLKEVRNRRAGELGIDRGTLLPNALVMEIARVAPRSQEEMVAVPGLRAWQAETLGESLLAVMQRKTAGR